MLPGAVGDDRAGMRGGKSHLWRRALATACALIGVAMTAQPAAAFDPFDRPTDDRKIDYYLQAFIVYGLWSEGGFGAAALVPTTLSRRTQPLRVRMAGGGYDAYIAETLEKMGRLTGLDVVVLPPDDNSENLLISNRKVPEYLRSPCAVMPSDRNGLNERRVNIYYDPTEKARAAATGGNSSTRQCIQHELLHVLGFHHAHEYPSVMSYAYQVDDLTELDLMMLRIFYDKRMKNGVNWLQAMTTARTVLAEVFAADGASQDTNVNGRQFVSNITDLMTSYGDSGDLHIQYLLGRAYLFGEGVPRDRERGYGWMRRAAEGGLVEGQLFLGYCFMNGKGVAADPIEGARWYRVAAELYDDRGLPWNDKRRGEYRSSLGPMSYAQNNLGVAYAAGNGVPKDEVEAYKWFSLSAGLDNSAGSANLRKLTTRLNLAQIAEGKRRAEVWLPVPTIQALERFKLEERNGLK